ncbi:MAG: cold shock domain-containing protein [Flavobacteriales bacterium]|nr:cold shock domain-containing protein [Flavobacteriales bacterium]
MKEGKVKFYNQEKGFGFITIVETNEEIFVHSSGLKDTIREDDRVQFTIAPGKKGPNAVDVQVID